MTASQQQPVPDLQAQAEALVEDWCTAVDTNDLTKIQGLFAHGGTFLTRGKQMNEPERAEFFTQLWATAPARSTHVCRDVTVTPDGDDLRIRARLAATFVLPDGTIRATWGHYDDRATTTDAGLRLLEKNITLERNEVLAEHPSE